MQAVATKQAKQHIVRGKREMHTEQPKGSGNTVPAKTFVVWSPMPTIDSGLAQAIHALYYLPENFVLMIPRKAIGEDELIPTLIAASPLASRVCLYSEADTPKGDTVDAIISGEMYAPKGSTPAVTVALKHKGLSESDHGYTVAPAPEAIASALLKISRAS